MVSITYLKQKVFVTLENVFSDSELINCSVQQGLRPLFFLRYINDLSQIWNKTRSYLYADDTDIFYQDKDVKRNRKSFKQRIFFTLWLVSKQ